MDLTLEIEKSVVQVGDVFTVRLIVTNTTYEPMLLNRQLLIGPNLIAAKPIGLPMPVSVEPAFDSPDKDQIWLNAWCLYGRGRQFNAAAVGQITIYGYLLREATSALLAQGPHAPELLAVAATPLVVDVQPAR